ncbi:MAG: YbaN family protein [Candidatus Thermoplasmatota archaeon]|nr:YbaN family protein [Candidatus Thermoplasmatota archaeon]
MRKRLRKGILVSLGTISLVLGIIGIFIPILPTTPFLLLAAGCYAKGSKRFYQWLMKNRWLGSYIRNYQEGRGIPLKVKIATILLLWSTMAVSIVMIISNNYIKLILFVIGLCVTIHILTIKTLRIT